MDFFLDTGAIFGYVNPLDKKDNEICGKFFKIYPLDVNNHSTNKKGVSKEIQNIRRKRLSDGQNLAFRDMELKLKEICRQIKDVNCEKHPLYRNIFDELYHFLEISKVDESPKDRDAQLLSHAFIWSCDATIINPRFITVDEKDINRNKTDLKKIAAKRLMRSIGLNIFTIREVIDYAL
jgi:hypothetical protein